MPIAWNYAARTDVGLVRSRNEDSGYAGPHLIAVADGMGGHAGGNVASSLVITRIARLDGDSHGCDDALELLAGTVSQANSDITLAVAEHSELHGMGTTLTGLMRCGSDNLVLVHIGDSRAYIVRDGNFNQMTTDHSFVQSLVDGGRLSPEEAESHPQRSLVTRVMTGAPEDEPDLSVRKGRVGDRYLICSDGLSDYVGRGTIEEVITAGDSPTNALKRLVDLALRAGAPDNVTVVIADVVDPSTNTSDHPIVVGAAAEQAGIIEPTQALSPAQKAAALRKRATGLGSEDEHEDVDDGSDAAMRSTGRRGLVIALVVVLTLAVGLFGAYSWTQDRYYLAEHNGTVGVYRGIPQMFGPVSLSTLEQTVDDIHVDNLPDFYRTRLEATIPASDRQDVANQVETLRVQQARCLSRIAVGAPCGSGTSEDPPTSSPSPPAGIPGALPPTAGPSAPTPQTATPTSSPGEGGP